MEERLYSTTEYINEYPEEREFARRDYEGLSERQAKRLKKYRTNYAKQLKKNYRTSQISGNFMKWTDHTRVPDSIKGHYGLKAAGKKFDLDTVTENIKDKSGKSFLKSANNIGGKSDMIIKSLGKLPEESNSDYTRRMIEDHFKRVDTGLRQATKNAKEYMRDEARTSRPLRDLGDKVASLAKNKNIKTAGKVAGGLALAGGIGYGGYKYYQKKHNKSK